MAARNLYEVLGVERHASTHEIRLAWRAATDRAQPGSAEFKELNHAAEVLLDLKARTAYDAKLGSRERSESRKRPPASTNSSVTHSEPEAQNWVRLIGSSWVTVSVTLLTLLVVAVGAFFWFQNRSHADQIDAGQEASSAAERALPFVLSYDYRQLNADQLRAERYLSPKYKKEYSATFRKLIKSSDGKPGPAEQTSAVVKANVRSVGVVDAESDVAKVIVFVDQATTKAGGTPKFSLNRLTVSMVKSGNTWLVDNINSY